MKEKYKKYIGNKAFYMMVMAIAVPIMIQNGLTNFVNLLDNIMVGRLGTEEMSGVSIVNQIIFVYNLCIFGGTAGVGIFTAQYFGQKNDEGIRSTFRYKIWLALIITVGAAFLLLFFGKQLILLYLTGENGGNEKLALEYGMTYLRIILLDLPAFMILQVYASTMRECGETVVPMKAGAAAVAVNLIFYYLLIYGKFGFPRLGVAGAAVATVLSRYTETAIVVIWAHTHEKENTYMTGLYKTLSVPRDHVKKYFIKGTPLLLNEALWSFGMAVLAQNYSVRGLTVIAAMNIANTINNLFSVVFAAMGESVAIIVGQALGFGDMKRAREIDNKMIVSCVLISFAVSVFMFLFAPFFPRIYNTTEAVRKAAMGLVLAQAVFIPQNAFLNAAYFTLRAGGKTGVTFFFDCVFLWCVNIPIVFVLCRYTGLAPWAVYSAMQIGEWLKCIAGAVMVKKGVWLENLTGKGEDEKYLLRENEEKH